MKVIIPIALLLLVIYLVYGQKSEKQELSDQIDALGTEIGQLLDAPPTVWTNWRSSLEQKPLTISEMKEYVNRLKNKLLEIKIQRGLA